MQTTPGWRTRLRQAYERHEGKWHLLFFSGGFLLDFLSAREGVDALINIVQQLAYLTAIGTILYIGFVRDAGVTVWRWPAWLERAWTYRSLAVHFMLGGLMNLYSIFFLMSASWFSTVAFAALLFGAVVVNELRAVQQSGLDVKVGLYVLCVFCFWSLMVPLILGRVGLMTFVIALIATLAVLAVFFMLLRRRLGPRELRRRLVLPAISVTACFVLFYWVGLIPPVPIAAKALGVYHLVERRGNDYWLHHERPWWKVWETGDEDFVARPGDRVFVFLAIFSPARFDDTVFVRWMLRGADRRWQQSDRIPIQITGGREGGFRGFTSKQNYTAGDWRVIVETRDGREIARTYFSVTTADADPARTFKIDVY